MNSENSSAPLWFLAKDVKSGSLAWQLSAHSWVQNPCLNQAADAANRKTQGSELRQLLSKLSNATQRQLKNARAYDRGGEYFEQEPNAHPVGSGVGGI